MIARSILRITLLVAFSCPISRCWSADPVSDANHKDRAVIKINENFNGPFHDLVGKEFEIVGNISFGKDTLRSKALGSLRGKFGFLYIPNWGDVWQNKKVRIIGKVSLYDGAEYMKDVWNNQPPAMQHVDHFKITIREIELLEDADRETKTLQQ